MFAAFWLIRRVHAAATGRVGLGFGDVKMAAAAAIWISPWNLPLFVFVASFCGLAFALGRYLLQGRLSMAQRQPFGPFPASRQKMDPLRRDVDGRFPTIQQLTITARSFVEFQIGAKDIRFAIWKMLIVRASKI